MNGEMNANNNINSGATNNRSSSNNGGFNISNLFDLSKLGNMFSNGTRGNNPLNNIRRMFSGNNMNRRYVGNRNMLKVLPIEEAYRRIKSGNILLIDVRTEMEYKTVKIKGYKICTLLNAVIISFRMCRNKFLGRLLFLCLQR